MKQYKNDFERKLLLLSFSAIQSRLLDDDDCSMECDDQAHTGVINDQYIITYDYDDFYAVDNNMIID